MNETLTWYHSDAIILSVLGLCKAARGDDRPAAVNMEIDNWEDKPHTLLNHMYLQKTYDTGGYGVYSWGRKAVAGSGYYKLEEGDDIYVTASRAYTVKGRHKNFNYLQGELWHSQLDMIKEQQGNVSIVTFNEYNKHMAPQVVRINDPDNWNTSFQHEGLWYRKIARRIQPLKLLPYAINYQYTKQWVAYAVHNPNYEMEFLDLMRSLRA